MKDRRVKRVSFILAVLLLLSLIIIKYSNSNKISEIDKVLKTNEYSYLPKEAKKYIKEVYEESGRIILTEKNKKRNEPYLNPSYVAYLQYSEEDKKELGEVPISLIVDYSSTDVASASMPSSYDLRNVNGKNYVSPIRNQGGLGICWAFASASSAESYLLKKSDTSYSSSSRLFTERQLDYATAVDGIKDYSNEYSSFVVRTLGDGGNFFVSTIAMANGISLVDYNNFKEYDDSDLNQMELAEVLSYNKSLYELNATVNMPNMDLRESTSQLTAAEKETRNNYINTIKQSIIDNGVVYVATYMDSACQYRDTKLNNTVIDVYNCSHSSGHAMGIIGWNDNIQYSYCNDNNNHSSNTTNCNNIVTGKGVWILKNSWGNSQQNPYLAYDSLESSVHFITELTNNKIWDNNYLFGDGEYGYQSYSYTLTNSRLRNDEIIKKIKFISMTENTTFTIRVKKKDGSFETISKTVALPGLVTVDVPNDVVVNNNTKITISSNGFFVDKLMVFTDNIDKDPFIDVEKYNNVTINENDKRFYSDTKNIASGSVITYRIYNASNIDVSNKISVTNNEVAENNINTSIHFPDNMEHGIYKVDAIYSNSVVGSFNINIVRMAGMGTEDQPFIITNGVQLSQMRNNPSAYYELGNDIDLTIETREGSLSQPSDVCPQVFGREAINGFSGSLDGKNHTIKGLYQNNYIYCTKEDGNQWWNLNDAGGGLFGTLKGNATIKNLILDGFDITCQDGYCGALVSNYTANMDEDGHINDDDKTVYVATFKNIAIKNSRVNGLGDQDLFGGGLFGHVESKYGTINIDSIYIDIDRNLDNFENYGYLLNSVEGNEVNIKNIHASGNNSNVLIEKIYANNPVSIKNILSTMTDDENLFGEVVGNNLSVSDINIINNGKTLCKDNKCSSAINVKMFDKDTDLLELTKATNYSSWDGFDKNWEIKTINGVVRIPVLKFMNFDYFEMNSITLNQQLNKILKIYDFLSPQIVAAKRISYKTNDEGVVIIREDGSLIPKKSGQTTIHIESLYDGYIKDVPITVNYVPHYTIHFDANGGEGHMEDIEVASGTSYNLPNNVFVKADSEFRYWNTKADGSGDSFSNLGQVPGMNDKEILTLYAIWSGDLGIVTFDTNGGSVEPTSKTVYNGEVYGELPIPKRNNYGFIGWYCNEDLVDSNDIVSCNNLKAGWQENSYTIVYDSNGGVFKDDYSGIGELYVLSNSLFSVVGGGDSKTSLNPFVRNGYEFIGWNTKNDGTGKRYQVQETISVNDVINSEVHLYAVWKSEEGTITYHANDGTSITKSQVFNYGVNVKLDKNTFTRNGYDFKRWNTKADGSGTVYNDEQVVNINDNLDLYAIWESRFDYEINGYNVSNGYISKITINTDVDAFKSYIRLGIGFTVDVDYKDVGGKRVLYTGGKTKIKKNGIIYREFTNSVTGEINGDGMINSADLLKAVKHLKGTSVLSGAFLKAADCNGDNTINSADLLKIVKFLKGTGSL